MAIVLITGNPGSGKTELARALTRLGHTALDADEIAHWESEDGAEVTAPEQQTAEWLQCHHWVWGRATLAAAIDEHAAQGGDLFVCGIAIDQFELMDLFDIVFLLSLDDATQHQRLNTPANASRNAAQRAQIVAGRVVFEQQARAAGAVALDATKPTPVLAREVLQEVAQRFD